MHMMQRTKQNTRRNPETLEGICNSGLGALQRAWLLNLPGSSVAYWEELHGLFVARFATPTPLAVAAILGGSPALRMDRHVKQFFHQMGAASVQQGPPPGWAAPKANLIFDSGDHPVTTPARARSRCFAHPPSTIWR